MENEAYLVFKRWPRWVYKLRRFDIMVDDQKMGSVANGSEERIAVAPGRHVVELKVSWIFKSQIQIVEVQAGEEILLECGTPLSFWSFIPAIFIVSGQKFLKYLDGIYQILLLIVFALASLYYLSLYIGRGKFLCLKDPQKL